MGWDPSGLTGCLCLKVSHKAAIKMLARAAVSSEGSSEGRCFKFNHMVVGTTWFFAGFCTEVPVLCWLLVGGVEGDIPSVS